jgi:aminomethyltransferase
MGELFFKGPDATEALDWLTCNAVKKLTDGRAQYSALLNEQGGVVDDVIVYRLSSENFLVCVNAANTDKDFGWITAKLAERPAPFNVQVDNRSYQWGQIALQGPLAVKIAQLLTGGETLGEVPYFSFVQLTLNLSDTVEVIAARTGYTGEDGFEFFVPWEKTSAVWDALLQAGEPHGLVPAGLGARDSLRLEACYPLHGHELADDVTALESGLGWIVKFEKGDFIGRSALWAMKEAGVPRSLAAFELLDPGIAREGDKILIGDREVGHVTSGTKTPTINKAIGLGLVETSAAPAGVPWTILVRGRPLRAIVVKRPFYKRQG